MASRLIVHPACRAVNAIAADVEAANDDFDPTFGGFDGDGYQLTPYFFENNIGAVAIQRDGKILLAGTYRPGRRGSISVGAGKRRGRSPSTSSGISLSPATPIWVGAKRSHKI